MSPVLGTARPAMYLRFPPNWDFIEPIRQYVDALARSAAPSVSERACIVAQELVENAVKFGDPSHEIELDLEVDRVASGRAIEIRVTNRANAARIAILRKEFDRVHSAPAHDAFARAFDRMRKAPTTSSSTLGLSRLASEALLRLEVVEDRVAMTARVRG